MKIYWSFANKTLSSVIFSSKRLSPLNDRVHLEKVLIIETSLGFYIASFKATKLQFMEKLSSSFAKLANMEDPQMLLTNSNPIFRIMAKAYLEQKESLLKESCERF